MNTMRRICGIPRTKALLLGLMFMVLTMSMTAPTASAYSQQSSSYTSARFNVYILDAYYADLDADTQEDDVFVSLGFELGYYLFYEFYYDISLTLPSGSSYTYTVQVLAWYDVIIIRNVFYNAATESGDYTVDVLGLMITPNLLVDGDSHVFDPPGGSGGGDPPMFEVY